MVGKRYIIMVLFTFLSLMPAGYLWAKPHPKNGAEREYYPNGKLRRENIWRNERIVRKRTYYRTGKLLSEFRYKRGQLILTRTFHENGRLKSLWTKKSGVTKFYYENGKLKNIVKS